MSPQPVAFMSYVRFDDEHENGRLPNFARLTAKYAYRPENGSYLSGSQRYRLGPTMERANR